MRSIFTRLLLVALFVPQGLAAASLPEPKADQGMLVLIRPGDPGGGDMVADFIFDGETPLAVTKGGTHKAVDIAPGEHMIWCQGGGDLIEVVPGQRYYIVCGFFHGFSLIDSDDGDALVAKTKEGPPLTPDRIQGAKKRVAKFYPPMKKSFDDLRRPFPVVAAPARPADPSGRVDVPRYSPVTLELMENLSSANNTTGERVSFRVIDAGSGEHAWAIPGTPVEGIILFATPSGRNARSGLLRVDIPAVTAADGTVVPVMGQVIGIGKSRAAAANLGFALFGFLGSSLVKGRDVVNFAGERYEFWSRDEAWITPAPSVASQEKRSADSVAKLTSPIDMGLLGRQTPPPMQLVVQVDGEVSSVDLLGVGDWTLPHPAKATAVRRGEGGWIADFSGWSLLRHLRISDPAIPARFRVTLADGKELIAEATPTWQKSQ